MRVNSFGGIGIAGSSFLSFVTLRAGGAGGSSSDTASESISISESFSFIAGAFAGALPFALLFTGWRTGTSSSESPSSDLASSESSMAFADSKPLFALDAAGALALVAFVGLSPVATREGALKGARFWVFGFEDVRVGGMVEFREVDGKSFSR